MMMHSSSYHGSRCKLQKRQAESVEDLLAVVTVSRTGNRGWFCRVNNRLKIMSLGRSLYCVVRMQDASVTVHPSPLPQNSSMPFVYLPVGSPTPPDPVLERLSFASSLLQHRHPVAEAAATALSPLLLLLPTDLLHSKLDSPKYLLKTHPLHPSPDQIGCKPLRIWGETLLPSIARIRHIGPTSNYIYLFGLALGTVARPSR